MITSPLLIAAIGGMICERSGVVNIALEGLMALGTMNTAVCHALLETKPIIPLLSGSSLSETALCPYHASVHCETVRWLHGGDTALSLFQCCNPGLSTIN